MIGLFLVKASAPDTFIRYAKGIPNPSIDNAYAATLNDRDSFAP